MRLLGLSQCTFWCSVLSDANFDNVKPLESGVSMHLLVLSAFRHDEEVFHQKSFTTVSMHLLVLSAFRPAPSPRATRPLCLNAPFGAQCFPTPNSGRWRLSVDCVSMHLLVLSAFRQQGGYRAR